MTDIVTRQYTAAIVAVFITVFSYIWLFQYEDKLTPVWITFFWVVMCIVIIYGFIKYSLYLENRGLL